MRPSLRSFSGFALAAAVAAGILSLSACGGGSSSATPTITSVSITPTAITVPLNTQTDFTAVVNLSNSTTTTTTTTTSTVVTWQVNGVTGGNSTTGTIVSSPTDEQVGVYTAPLVVPTTNNGQVNVTAIATQTNNSSSTSTTTITSNTAVVTIGTGLGLATSPTTAIVSAGSKKQFSATLNGLTDANATWSVSSANGGSIGTIDPNSGVYTAPLYPPPGGTVTITATDGANTATSTVSIIYSDASLNGSYAFSYTGADSSGYLSAAGSFVADGSGHILSGVEDVNSLVNGVSTEQSISGTYVITTDGRGTAVFNGSTIAFALTTNQHAEVIRFNTDATGSGTIDQQNLNDLVVQSSVISGPYAFSVSGMDSSFKPLAVAGKFYVDGNGNLPSTNVGAGIAPVVDENDNSTVKTSDTSLSGSYSFDVNFPGSGRGTLTFTSTATGQLQFAFYVTDATHLHMVEIDHAAHLGGDAFSAPTGTSFSSGSFVGANYAFVAGGNSSAGSDAAGGVFAASGSGAISSGVLDTNNAGTVKTATALGTCTYSVNGTTGRIDLELFAGSGACPATPNANISEFAVYQTLEGPDLMIEVDPNAITTGLAFQQQAIPASYTGNFALGIAGQGFFHSAPASYQPDTSGQVTLAGTALGIGIGGGGGNLDINNFSATFPSDILSTTTSTLTIPAATTGRGTMLLNGTNPNVTYTLIYYPVSANLALLFDQDKTRIAIGHINLQF